VNVSFDRPQAAYFAGQTVRGSIVVRVLKPQTIDGIYIVCNGKAKVHFTRQHTRTVHTRRNGQSHSHTETRTVHYRAREDYFNQRINLVQIGNPFTFQNGEYSYPFAFTLPSNIPTSFENIYGKIRYSMTVVIGRQNKSDLEYQIPFTVNSIVDLNSIQEAQMPTEGTNSKTLGFLFCQSKPITVKAWLDHIGYVPGQNIMFCALVNNPTNKKMRGTKVQLIQHVSCRAEGETENASYVIAEQAHGKFLEADEWDNVAIQVPPVVPSGLPFCNIISVAYRLKFILDPRAMSTNLNTHLNIVIGNIPLRSRFTSFRRETTPSAPPLPSYVGDIYHDLPPPSYDESTFSSHIQDDEEETGPQFKPCYLTYASN